MNQNPRNLRVNWRQTPNVPVISQAITSQLRLPAATRTPTSEPMTAARPGIIRMNLPTAAGTAETHEVEIEVGRGPVGCDDPAVRQQLAGVLEHDNAVAQQAPALLRVRGHNVGGLAVRCVRSRAGRLMRTVHDPSPGARPRWNSLPSLMLAPAPGKAAICDARAAIANPDAPHTRRRSPRPRPPS